MRSRLSKWNSGRKTVAATARMCVSTCNVCMCACVQCVHLSPRITCVRTRIYVLVDVICACVHVSPRMNGCMYVCVCVYIYIYMQEHTCMPGLWIRQTHACIYVRSVPTGYECMYVCMYICNTHRDLCTSWQLLL